MIETRAKFGLIALALLAEATVAAAQGGVAGARDPNRLICRRTTEIGSLVRSRRQCFTRAEWDRIAASEQEGARKTIDGLSTRQGGN